MIIHVSKEGENLTYKWIMFIGILEVLSGTFGIMSYFRMIINISNIENIILFSCRYLPLFILSLIAGIMLLRGYRSGIFYSMVIQVLQFIDIAIWKFSYTFISFLIFGIYIDWPKVGIEWSISPKCQISIAYNQIPFRFGVNIVAVIFFYRLLKYYKELKIKEVKAQESRHQ